MTNKTNAGISVLVLTPEGEVADADLPPGDVLWALNSVLGSRYVDVVRLTDRIDMWLDDEGLCVDGAQVNVPAGVVAAAYGFIYQPYAGRVLFAEHDDEGNTVSLSPEARSVILDLLLGAS